jgi:hypothetical protein
MHTSKLKNVFSNDIMKQLIGPVTEITSKGPSTVDVSFPNAEQCASVASYCYHS